MIGLEVHTGAPAEHGDGEESGLKEEKENRKEWQWERGPGGGLGTARDPGERPWGMCGTQLLSVFPAAL